MAAPDSSQSSTNAPAGAVPALELAGTPGHLVRCAQQVHSALWHREFDGELTSPQYAVMSTLTAHPGIDQRSAGLITSLDKSNIADVVRRLEQRGWLTRTRDADDARRNVLALTDEAADAVVSLSPRVARVQGQLLARVPKAHRPRFLDSLARVAYGGRDAVPEPDRDPGPVRVQLSTAPGHLLRRAEQVHYAMWSCEFGNQVTSPQYAVILALLTSPEPLDQRTAGEVASLDKSSVADVVRRLERRGWLTRVRDAGDGRRRLLQLTPAALYAVPNVTEGVRRVQERLVEPLSAEERRCLLDGLSAVIGAESGGA